ncbi:AhpD-like protein [Durotheca rogersii]|uniref:AhpD-like protein n=1 Tax=Durotheca rogersii TaxID=419775 RepID=UPI00221F3327|nr:AhpD-like protein [Durotheca rogersii]KAI5860056.1 AhpD-like protein [Durotheca rogersii]
MRIPYAAPDPAPDSEEAAIVGRIAARRAPRPLQPLDLALLQAPPMADGWNAFLGAVRTRGAALGARARELAVCRVAVCNRAWYEWAHHAPLAAAAGVSAEALRRVVARRDLLVPIEEEEGEQGGEGQGDDEGQRERSARDFARGLGLDDKDWAVLRYADEMTRNVEVPDPVFDALKALCSDREIVEATTTIAAYNCVSRFLVALDGMSPPLSISLSGNHVRFHLFPNIVHEISLTKKKREREERWRQWGCDPKETCVSVQLTIVT